MPLWFELVSLQPGAAGLMPPLTHAQAPLFPSHSVPPSPRHSLPSYTTSADRALLQHVRPKFCSMNISHELAAMANARAGAAASQAEAEVQAKEAQEGMQRMSQMFKEGGAEIYH